MDPVYLIFVEVAVVIQHLSSVSIKSILPSDKIPGIYFITLNICGDVTQAVPRHG